MKINSFPCNKAFTLAETLITLLVIGVVAALTIPALMQNISDYTLSKQRKVFTEKFNEGLRQMRIDGKLEEKYESTQAFVDVMKNYFKIAQVCDKDNLTNCFTKTFNYSDVYGFSIGEKKYNFDSEKIDITYNVANLKTTQAIKSATGLDSPNYNSDVLGIVFIDGVQMLITVDPDCIGIASGDTTGNLFSCFGYIADINSSKSPNIVKKDILTNIPLADVGFEIVTMTTPSGSACPSAAYDGRKDSSYCYLTSAQESSEVIAKYGLRTQLNYSLSGDYWGGAMKYCIDKGLKLPNAKQLTKMANAMGYDENNCGTVTTNSFQPYYQNCNSAIDRSMINNSTILWSRDPNESRYSYLRSFNTAESKYYSIYRSNKYLAVCVK